jgi:hypothetical protein
MVEWVHIQVRVFLQEVHLVVVALAVKTDFAVKMVHTVILKVVVLLLILVHEAATVVVVVVQEELLGRMVAKVVLVDFELSGQETLDNSQAQTLVMLLEIQCTGEAIGVDHPVRMDVVQLVIIPTCLVRMA